MFDKIKKLTIPQAVDNLIGEDPVKTINELSLRIVGSGLSSTSIAFAILVSDSEERFWQLSLEVMVEYYLKVHEISTPENLSALTLEEIMNLSSENGIM